MTTLEGSGSGYGFDALFLVRAISKSGFKKPQINSNSNLFNGALLCIPKGAQRAIPTTILFKGKKILC